MLLAHNQQQLSKIWLEAKEEDSSSLEVSENSIDSHNTSSLDLALKKKLDAVVSFLLQSQPRARVAEISTDINLDLYQQLTTQETDELLIQAPIIDMPIETRITQVRIQIEGWGTPTPIRDIDIEIDAL